MRNPPRAAGWRGLLWTAGLAVLAGCDSLTSVDAPDVIEPTSLETPEGALALRAGALRRFDELYGSGLTEGIVGASGLVTDELVSGETTLRSDTDARREVDLAITGWWTTLGTARQAIVQAIPYMLQYQPAQGARTGQLFSLLGMTEVLVGENACSGATLSRAAGGQPVYGASLTTAQVFDSALVHFDSAVTLSADSAGPLNLALIGRGRTLLNLGRFDEAAAAVATVPTEFVYHAEFGDAAQQNSTFSGVQLDAGVADRQGTNGLDYVTGADPRVPTQFRNIADDGVTQMYGFTPYATTASPIVVASGREARLIEAEAALRAGDAPGWLGALNALRAGFTPALAPLVDPSDEAARVDLMFRERAFWLFLTAHRLGDLRRLITQYGRAPDAVFPTGTYKDGVAYGSATYLALPTEETFNPNFTGCDAGVP